MDIRDDGMTASRADSALDDDTRLGGTAPQPKPDKPPANKLDSKTIKRRLSMVREWYDQEWERQAYNRYQMAMDEDYYDSLQWTEDEAAELIDRGQAPTVRNEIKPTIDWLIGTERRTRIDYKVLPRRKAGEGDAEAKTKLMKYVSDVNKEPFARSKAFARTCKGGLGWLEVGIRGDRSDEPVFYRSQDWRYIMHDSNATEMDLDDGRYIFRWKYLDLDVAEAVFPRRKDIVRRSVIEGNFIGMYDNEEELWYMGARVTESGQDYATASPSKYRPYDGSAFVNMRRERVKIYECWYRLPVKRKVMIGAGYSNEPYDQDNPEHQAAISDQAVSLYDRVELEMRVILYTDAGCLWEGPSPYKHQRFPFVPIWAYRRARDNAPYGPARPMRDSQDALNKRESKALWILSSNRVQMDDGAVDDIEELRDEVSRPDSIIIKHPGKELVIERDIQLAREHLMMMDRDQVYIRNGGGVTSENLGRETNADSGKAIIARQEQGGVVTTELFDNLRYAVQLAGEIKLSVIEQFYTDEKEIRIVGERGIASFVEFNKEDPATGEIINDIAAQQADFVVSEQDFKDSLRIAMFESLFDIVSRLAQMNPQIALNLLDLVVEMADIPNRDEFVTRIRQISGMRDPEKEPTEEEVLAERQRKALEQKQIDLQMARLEADLREAVSKGEKLSADALKAKLDAMAAAFEAAGLVVAAPGLTAVADDLLESAGFQDATPEDGLTDEQPQQAPPPETIPAPQSPFDYQPTE